MDETKPAWLQKKSEEEEVLPLVCQANIHDAWMDWKAWKLTKDVEQLRTWSVSVRVDRANLDKLMKASGNEGIFIRKRAAHGDPEDREALPLWINGGLVEARSAASKQLPEGATVGLCWRRTKRAPLGVRVLHEHYVAASKNLQDAGVGAQKTVQFVASSFWVVAGFPMDRDEADLIDYFKSQIG